MLMPDQIRPHVLHGDRYVRHAALDYFADSYSRDETLIPDILQLSETYGDKRNIHGLAVSGHLPVNEQALLGLLDRLAQSPDENVQFHLNRTIGSAPVALLAKHNAIILANPHILDKTRHQMRHRCELVNWSGDRLWTELQDFARRSESKQAASEIDLSYAAALVEALAPHDVPDADTVCRLLREADEKNGDGWREIFLIDLAGGRGIRETIPILVGKFRVDTDYMLDETSVALRKMGDPLAVQLIGGTFLKETWDFKNYATGVLGAIKSPESETTVLALLESERDINIRTMLCHELCLLFSERGVEVVRQQIHDGYDEMMVVLEESLLPVIDVLGMSLPEVDQWRQEREGRDAAIERRKRELDGHGSRWLSEHQPPQRSEPFDSTTYQRYEEKVGRNDPCPCGSGKKYKKCCGKN